MSVFFVAIDDVLGVVLGTAAVVHVIVHAVACPIVAAVSHHYFCC